MGYTQIDATLNCYLRPDRFDALPVSPVRLDKQGAEVFLVSRESGECVGCCESTVCSMLILCPLQVFCKTPLD